MIKLWYKIVIHRLGLCGKNMDEIVVITVKFNVKNYQIARLCYI